jgi:hypothetical protein
MVIFCVRRSTGARNDYILALASANAHQERYFKHDLQVNLGANVMTTGFPVFNLFRREKVGLIS